jgi:hypothetical protein
LIQYPKSYKDNLAWRRETLVKARDDLSYREKCRALFFQDPLYAFNCFFWTLDVRKKPEHHLPFMTYDYQDEVILDLVSAIRTAGGNNAQDRLIEKSRDMGISWLVILTFEYLWLNPSGGYDFLLGSRIEDYVDKKGDMRTLFEKARYNLYRLPQWLQPKDFSGKTHDNFMRLINPETGSSITGESNNASFSTGGRYAGILLDEFAKWENNDDKAWTASGDASPCRVAVSTPWGAAGKFYELAHDDKIKKHTLHWSLHPEKRDGLYCSFPKPVRSAHVVDESHWTGLRSRWYDEQTLGRTRTGSDIAQELDIDYIGAGNPVFDGPAGDRISILIKSDKTPVSYLQPILGETNLMEVENPYEHSDYVLIYDKPNQSLSYVVACDVAEGKETGDYSIVKVLCRETRSVVASYASRVDEVALARIIVALTHMYSFGSKEPWWAVETNGPGLALFDLLTEVHDLPNAFLMPIYDTVKNSISYRKGWWTSVSSRRALVGGIKEWLIEGTGWCDKRCCREFNTFIIDKTGKAIAKQGANDDEVMCLGVALQVDRMAPDDDVIKQVPQNMAEFEKSITFVEKTKKIIEPSLEEACMLHALSQKSHDSMLNWHDSTGSMFEQVEELYY